MLPIRKLDNLDVPKSAGFRRGAQRSGARDEILLSALPVPTLRLACLVL